MCCVSTFAVLGYAELLLVAGVGANERGRARARVHRAPFRRRNATAANCPPVKGSLPMKSEPPTPTTTPDNRFRQR